MPIESDHLTAPDPGLAQLQSKTAPGMAHWAGSGPSGRTCRTCVFWTGAGGGRNGYYADGRGLMPRACLKYKNLMHGKRGAPVEHWRWACRHYEENPQPPTMHQK